MLSSVIHNKDFLKLWLAQLSSQIALNALLFILTIKVYQITFLNTSVSLLILSFGLPAIVFGYFAGVYVDKLGLKRVLVWTNILRTLFIIPLFWALKAPIFIYPIMFFISLATQFFVPAEGASIPALVERKSLISANSLFSLTLSLAMVVGFVGAGPILRVFGLNGALIVLFSLFLIALILVASLPKSLAFSLEKEGNFFRAFFEGLVFIWRNREVRTALFFLTMTQSLIMVLATVGPGFVHSGLGLEVEEISLVLMAPAALGMILGSLFLSRWGNKIKGRSLVNGSILSAGITLLILSFVVKQLIGGFAQILTVLLSFILGFENSVINIPATTLMQLGTPEDLRGRVYGVFNTLVFGAAILPVLVAGTMADIFGVPLVIFGSGLISLLIGIYRIRSR